MKNNKSNILLYGLLIGGLAGAGVAIYFTSKYFTEKRRINRVKKNKFYEGIEEIFDSKDVDSTEDADNTPRSNATLRIAGCVRNGGDGRTARKRLQKTLGHRDDLAPRVESE